MADLVVELKSNTKADKFRNEGNASYRADDFFAALIHYNQSLCFAETSEMKSLAYANRSAVYLEVKKYQQCLENVQLAREHGYPEEKLSKLDEREVKCHDLMKDNQTDPLEDPWNFFKLSYPAHEKLPFIVECLELKEDKKYGRLIATNRDLEPGDIVLIEEPWFKFLSLNYCYERCNNCTKENMLSLIPCNGRCVNTMYCSEKCAKSAKSRHRQFECGAQKNIQTEKMTIQKMLIDSMNIAGGIEKLQACIKANEKLTIFDIDMTNPEDPQVKKQQLIAFLNLNVLPEEWKSIKKSPHRKSAKALLQNMPIKLWNKPKDLELLIETVLRMMILNGNVTSEVKFSLKFPESGGPPKLEEMIYGSPITLCGALFNHSCDPNVNWLVVENKFVAVVQYPIKAGEQLFVCYREYFYHQTLEERRKVMLEERKFLCDCNACINNYTLSDCNRVFDTNFVRHRKVHLLGPSELFTEFQKNCECIKKNFKNHPCRETIVPIIRNQMILEQFSDFGYFKGSLKLLANKSIH